MIRLPDLTGGAVIPAAPAIRTVEDRTPPTAEAVASDPVRTPEAGTPPATSQYAAPPAEPHARRLAAKLVDELARRSLRTVLAPLGTIANVYLILQRPKVWLAASSALAVQVVAALLFNGPAEPLPPKARPAWSAGQLPPAAVGSARKSADVAPVEIVVPPPDDFDASPSRALQAEQDPAGPKYEMPPADGKTAPPEAELARQAAQSDDAALRLAVRPLLWPSFKSSGATAIEPGVATLQGIEPLDSPALDTALHGGQP